MEALVIGRPNCGKTLFTINFALYMGISEIAVEVQGGSRARRIPLAQARQKWVSPTSHRVLTRLEIPLDTGGLNLVLCDTVGIPEGVHPDPEIRHAAARTLERMAGASIVLLMIDASLANPQSHTPLGSLDDELVQLCQVTGYSLIVANKIDRDGREEGLRRIRQRYPTALVLPTSALTRRGFREIKQHLQRQG